MTDILTAKSQLRSVKSGLLRKRLCLSRLSNPAFDFVNASPRLKRMEKIGGPMWRRFEEMPFLIAEDSDEDLLMLQRALRRGTVPNPQLATASGEETIAYLQETLALEGEAFPVILF